MPTNDHQLCETSTFDDVIDVLETLARERDLMFRLEAGRILLDVFFQGDAHAYLSRDPTKDQRFALFVTKNDERLQRIRLREGVARRCIKARIVYATLPDAVRNALFFSQVTELCRLHDPSLRAEVAIAAVRQDWTVRELRLAVDHALHTGVLDADPAAPGPQLADPPVDAPPARGRSHQPGRMVSQAEKWVAEFDDWRDRFSAIDAAKLTPPQRQRVREAAQSMRARLAALDAALKS